MIIWTPDHKREFLNRYDRGDSHASIVRWATTIGASIGVTSVPPYVTQFRTELDGAHPTPKLITAGDRPKLDNFSRSKLDSIIRRKGLTAAQVGAQIAQPVAWYLTGRATPYSDGPAQRLAEALRVTVADFQDTPAKAVPADAALRAELAKTKSERDAAKEERDTLFKKLQEARSVLA